MEQKEVTRVPHTTNSGISQVELQTLRHLINDADTGSKKFQMYAQECQNPELRNWVQQQAQSCDQKKHTLMQFLSSTGSV